MFARDTNKLILQVVNCKGKDALSAALQAVTGANLRTEGDVVDTVFPTVPIGTGALMPDDNAVIRLFRAHPS